MSVKKLAIVLSHPVQYYSPLFAQLALQQELKIFYAFQPNPTQQGKDGFGQAFQWDVNLLSGYRYEFVTNVSKQPSSSHLNGCDTPTIGERIKAFEATHIVTIGWHLKMYRQTIKYAKKYGIPIAVRGDSQLNRNLPIWKRVVKKVYYPYFLGQFDAFLSVGERNKAYLMHYGVNANKIIFSPHAVDQKFWNNVKKGRNDFTFIWVGKFIKLKRPFDVIEAFIKFQEKYRDSKLIMVGSGELLQECEKLTKSYKGIQLMGFKNQTELRKLYQHSDCLILTSDSESWGLVVNEAFAAGVPAIVSEACGCAPDLINANTGAVYSTGDLVDLESCMNYLHQKLSSAEGEMGIKTAIASKNSEYSFNKVVESFKTFINQY